MKLISLILVVYLAFSHPVNAAPRIADLNFELRDNTTSLKEVWARLQKS